MMRHARMPFGAASALALLCLVAGSAFGAAPQSTELWGGPGAKGAGQLGAQFDTTIYINALTDATCTVDFYSGGQIASTTQVSVPARGSVAVPTPDSLANTGPYLYHIRSTAAVTAYSTTFNTTAAGQFSLSLRSFTAAEFLSPGDEASGGGADASSSTDPGRARTNVGVLCNPNSAQACMLEVAAFSAGTLLGTGSLQAAPGAAAQGSLAALVPAAADHALVSLRLRVFSGSSQPFITRVINSTNDGAEIPTSVVKSAFSTAPTINSFTVNPVTGCAPQPVTLTWATTGAVRVTISGAAGDLPPSGTTTVTLPSSTDLVLTAYSITGETASLPRHVTVLPSAPAPTPSPSDGTVSFGGIISGIIPPSGGPITAQFIQHESSGSTFTLNGNVFVYVAGSTAGTDVVRLSAQGPCGAGTADFTATVVAPGTPQITKFFAEPSPGCAPANIVLYWNTIDATQVQISGIDFPLTANGAYGVTISTTTTFTLTAIGAGNKKATKTLVVPVDTSLQTPILSQNNITVPAGSVVDFTVSGISNPDYLNFRTIQRGSGNDGYLQQTGPLSFRYYAGGSWPATDIYWITYRNGCGSTYTEFKAYTTQP